VRRRAGARSFVGLGGLRGLDDRDHERGRDDGHNVVHDDDHIHVHHDDHDLPACARRPTPAAPGPR